MTSPEDENMKDRASLICRTADEIEETIAQEEKKRLRKDNPEHRKDKKTSKDETKKKPKPKKGTDIENKNSVPLSELPLAKVVLVVVVVLLCILVLVGVLLACLYLMGGWYMSSNITNNAEFMTLCAVTENIKI